MRMSKYQEKPKPAMVFILLEAKFTLKVRMYTHFNIH